MTPPGIEHATFKLVAQCLKQLRHHEVLTYSSSKFIDTHLLILCSYVCRQLVCAYVGMYKYLLTQGT